MPKRRYGNYVLVTGASSGIGKATALLFAERGYHVYALSRRAEEKTQTVGDGSITGLAADVTKPQTLEKAFSQIKELNIVIHCAGLGVSGSAECTPDKAARLQMDTNYFGVLNVNRFALPLLRKNSESLVLITSSVAGFIPIPFQSHYSSSKYALEAYGEALRMEAKPYGVRVCLVEPGDTKTGFTAARTYDEPADSPYFEKCKKAVERMEHDEQNGKDPSSVARVFLRQASRKNPKARVAVGFIYKFFAFLIRILPVKLKQFILSIMY
ncbi:MAG: SDR family oxidoreductase [Sphaerochaetaceae bacterium]|nr:SDR family oxidoreductase [Sphaerochaetaceae bacterium]